MGRDSQVRNCYLTLCSVSLTLDADQHYQFAATNDAFQALRDKQLLLTETAFSNYTDDVEPQMGRIAKYMQRGFRWGHPRR